jgi:hypothetical protein
MGILHARELEHGWWYAIDMGLVRLWRAHGRIGALSSGVSLCECGGFIPRPRMSLVVRDCRGGKIPFHIPISPDGAVALEVIAAVIAMRALRRCAIARLSACCGSNYSEGGSHYLSAVAVGV